ncbi:chorismate synthase [bacterium]|nr:chorismate synthase [bacterium]MBU1636835.1 chorismate synthase [bacterium]MBU1921172.1 chorismate synthase [bacterium]
MKYLTAGESHGKCLTGILEGMPAGLALSEEDIAIDLRRRQQGYGRSDRMKIEQDIAHILSGVRHGKTLGSPITLQIENKDWVNWQDKMSITPLTDESRIEKLTRPRPGHADLAGAIKYQHEDIRNVIERASARETAMRVALGAVCRKFFGVFGIQVVSHVINIGGVEAKNLAADLSVDEISARGNSSGLRCLDCDSEVAMIAKIDQAMANKDTLGGIFEVIIEGLPVGVGSYVHGDRRLDGILAQAMLSIHAMKAVGIGLGENSAHLFGSELHDRLLPNHETTMKRPTNNAGGIEGGMSNGERIRLRVAMKPLSTIGKPMDSVDLKTGKSSPALSERSDVCAVPAACVVGEAMALLAMMNPFLEKYGGDSMVEIHAHLKSSPGLPWA